MLFGLLLLLCHSTNQGVSELEIHDLFIQLSYEKCHKFQLIFTPN